MPGTDSGPDRKVHALGLEIISHPRGQPEKTEIGDTFDPPGNEFGCFGMRHIVVFRPSEGDKPDLVGLLTLLLQEAIRLRVRLVQIGSRQGGSLDWTFQDGSISSERFPTWMYTAIRESQDELLLRVREELVATGKLSATYFDNRLQVMQPDGTETVLEMCE